MFSIENLWWEQITTPAKYLKSTTNAIFSRDCLFLEEPTNAEEFLEALQQKIAMQDSSLYFKVLQAEDFASAEKFEAYLLETFDANRAYRAIEPLAAYLLNQNLLRGITVVRHVQNDAAWLNLIAALGQYGFHDQGKIVFTYQGFCPMRVGKKGVKILSWREEFSLYDMQLFAAHCIAEKKISGATRDYITHLAARISQDDFKLCSRLISLALIDDPQNYLQSLLLEFPSLNAYLSDEAEFKQLLWEAQVQAVFPEIERQRRRLVEKYASQLRLLLPQKDDFQQNLTKPEDMELRHILHYFYLPNPASMDKNDDYIFHLIYGARNQLAHLQLLDIATLKELLTLKDIVRKHS